MARLASIEKGGFYPTPPEITNLITNCVELPNGGRVLDPCCGEGVALDTLSRTWKAEPYGSELNRYRSYKAQELVRNYIFDEDLRSTLPHQDLGLSRVINDDFQNISAPKGSFQVLFLNPPYDWDKEDGRLEYTFLKRATWWLQPGGLLIFVIPRYVLKHDNINKYLSSWYEEMQVRRFPEPDYSIFKQIVVFGIKKESQTTPNSKRRETLIKMGDADRPLPDLGNNEIFFHKYTIGAPKPGRFSFAGLFHDLHSAEEEWKRYGNTVTPEYDQLFESKNIVEKQPLMPFKLGHLAGLISAGLLNHTKLEIKDENGEISRSLLIKGHVRKGIIVGEEVSEDDNGNKRKTEIKREIPLSEVYTINESGETQIVAKEELPEFMDTWLPQLTEAVNRDYEPIYKFDLGKYEERIGKRGELMPAQKHAVAAIATRLEIDDDALIVGEMGVGKTRIAAATIAATKHRRVIIMVPPHLVNKWIREVQLVLPEANVIQIDRIHEVDKWMALDKKKQIQVGVIKYTSARSASGWVPSFNDFRYFTEEEEETMLELRKAMANPEKYSPPAISQSLREKMHLFGKWYRKRADVGVRDNDMGEVLRDNKGFLIPHETILKSNKQFSRIRKGKQFELSKQRERYVPMYQFKRYKYNPADFSKILRRWDALKRFQKENPGQHLDRTEKKPAYKGRWRIADYIKDHYKNRIDLAIFDEVHKLKGTYSDQGYAFHRLSVASKQTLGMTGTIYGGKASTIFPILYRTCSDIREAFTSKHLTGRSRIREADWVDAYGFYEYRSTTTISSSSVQSGNKKTSEYVKEAPGSSPAMLPWILERTVFLSLADLGCELPDYTEIPQPVKPTDEMIANIKLLESQLGSEMRQRLARGDRSLLASYLQANLCMPDAPWRDEIVTCPKARREGKELVLAHIPALPNHHLYPKEKAIVDLIKKEFQEKGRRTLLLCQQTDRRNITPYWEEILSEAGMKPVTLKGGTSNREKWIAKQVKNGKNVLITHPGKVEVGLDLLEFPTVIWMGTEYSVYTVQQASRRPYRIGQDVECRIYFFYYEQTMQEVAVSLIAQKAAASISVNGDVITDDSLAAMESDNIEAELTKMIVNNEQRLDNKNMVHELFKKANGAVSQAATFIGGYKIKDEEYSDKMVVTKEDDDETEEYVVVSKDEPTEEPKSSKDYRIVFGASIHSTRYGKARSKKKKKPAPPKQMSLFDAMFNE